MAVGRMIVGVGGRSEDGFAKKGCETSKAAYLIADLNWNILPQIGRVIVETYIPNFRFENVYIMLLGLSLCRKSHIFVITLSKTQPLLLFYLYV